MFCGKAVVCSMYEYQQYAVIVAASIYTDRQLPLHKFTQLIAGNMALRPGRDMLRELVLVPGTQRPNSLSWDRNSQSALGPNPGERTIFSG